MGDGGQPNPEIVTQVDQGRTLMPRYLEYVPLVAAVLSLSHLGLLAQNESRSTVLARAGLITVVEGTPSIITPREPHSALKLLSPGDRIETRENDRVEVALNPGSYLRIGSGSRVEVMAADLDGMHFRITEGKVIVDTSTFNPTHHALHFSTPVGTLQVAKPGLCRINASPHQLVEVKLHRGVMQWVQNEAVVAELKAARRYLLNPREPGNLQPVKIERGRGHRDDLDIWNVKRAKLLAKTAESSVFNQPKVYQDGYEVQLPRRTKTVQ